MWTYAMRRGAARLWQGLRRTAAAARARAGDLALAAAVRAETGQSMVEYALIIAVVAIGSIVVLNAFTGVVGQVFTNIMTKIQGLGR